MSETEADSVGRGLPLPLEEWSDTAATLHLWMQIVGKVRLVQSPWINHSWHVTLYVTARGLTTSPIPHGDRAFEIDFDFVDHRLRMRSSDGREAGFALEPQTVAAFYARLMEQMATLDLRVKIYGKPNEIADPIPFAKDEIHRAYDRGVREPLLAGPRAGRPRLQGVPRPLHRQVQPGAPLLGRPGHRGHALLRAHGSRASGRHPEPAGLGDPRSLLARGEQLRLLGRAAARSPIPRSIRTPTRSRPDSRQAPVKPAAAFYSNDLREFILPYDAVRQSKDPDATLLEFLQTTYEAAANLAAWDRAALERTVVRP